MKALFRLLLRFLYRFDAVNDGVLTTPGPVLLVPNHVSWLDWLFLWVCVDDDWKFVTSSVTARSSWLHRRIMLNRQTFPIDTNSPYAVKRMTELLQNGGRLVLFAEGRISLTGSLMKLFDGTGFLLFKTHARVITAYLRGADRLPFVRHSGWTQWFPKVTVHFSDVLLPPRFKQISTTHARQRLTNWLLDHMVRHQFETEMACAPATPLSAIAHTAALRPRTIALEDMTRQTLTFRRLMVGADLLAQEWRTRFTGQTPERIGVLLPNVNATPVVLLSLWMANRVPSVLNYSTGTSTMLHCIRLAELKQLITARSFVERAKIDLEPFRTHGLEVIYLEDVRTGISSFRRFTALARQTVNPKFKIQSPAPEVAVVLFTSGSEGIPKGVELTHRNLMANIRQMLAVIDLTDADRLFNCLPMFHSFGLTVGTLLPLVRGIYTFIYPSPLHYRVVPAAVYDRACTVMLSTNTFLNGYSRKAHPYDLRSIRYVFAAAEKLQDATAQMWARQFGVRLLEGYGATECGPCLTVNTALAPRYGSTGRFLPGIEHKIEPIEGVADGGKLLVRGPNVMRGYLNPDANAQFKAMGGWYDTGDIARVDEEGFLQILGRLKRFAKVSGEMVSLTAVENALAGAFPQFGLRCQVAVLSRPDSEKGEVLIAVTNEPKLQLDQIRTAIRASGLSNLCAPREVKIVREIPKLGSGKIDHRELEKMAPGIRELP